MTRYFRVSLGQGGRFAEEAREAGWIGLGWMAGIDLTNEFPDTHAEFRKRFNPIVLESGEVGSMVAAGLACGMTFTVCKFMQDGDIVMSRMPSGEFQVGRVSGPYYYEPGQELPHRRPVTWQEDTIDREEMSAELRSILGSAGTVQWIARYPDDIQRAFEEELERLIGVGASSRPAQRELEDGVSFLLEKYLEEFLVGNWARTPLGELYDFRGNQVSTETGPLDILAESKDGSELVVIELKLGRTSDSAVGQVQRYMGSVLNELAAPGQKVKGIIIGLQADKRIELALSVAPNIEFYRYQLDFTLHKVV